MGIHKRYFLLTCFLLFTFNLYAQYEAKKPSVINFSKQNYHAENQNWSIATTDKGVVYIANNKGLLEFDGSNWQIYKMPDDLTIRSVAVGKNGRIYVGAYEEFGFWKIDEANRKHYVSLSDSLSRKFFHNDEIWRIIPQGDTVYFQSFNSIYLYSSSGIDIFPLRGPFALLSESRNRLFIQKINDGLFELKGNQLNFIEGSRIFQDDEIKFVLPFGKNRHLIGASEMGLYIWDEENFTPWITEARKVLNSSQLNNAIKIDSLYIIGTIVNGIFVFNQEGALEYQLNSGNYLQNNTVLSLHTDKNDNFWAGLDRGIDYVNMNSPLDFYVYPEITVGSVYASALYGNKVWIGSNQGLFHFDFQSTEGLYNQQLMPGTQGQIWQIKKLDNNLIFGHNNGTYQIDRAGNLKKISDVSGGFDFRKFRMNDKQYAIQSTYSNLVVYRYEKDNWIYDHTIEDFVEPVSHIEMDHMGYLWGKHSHKGIIRLKLSEQFDSLKHLDYFNEEQGLNSTRHANVSKINERIVFTTGEKLYTYDYLKNNIIPYYELNDKIGEFSKARKIVDAGNAKYWFILESTIGLFKINENEVKKMFSYDLERRGLNLLSRYPEIVPLNDSLHLICLDNGFAIYEEDKRKTRAKDITVQIRKAIAKTKEGQQKYFSLNKNRQREISYSHRTVEFIFASFDVASNPVFRYKLQGLNNQFSGWTNRSEVSYTRLPYGDYTFVVQTKDIYGDLSPETTFLFRIKPPWYLSTKAIVIYFVLVLLGAYFLRILFLKRLRKHAIEVEQREKEKRRREQMLVEQRYMQMKTKDLQSEIASKSIELANYTMTIINKNEVLLKIKEELQELKKQLGPRFPNYHYRKLIKILEKNLSSEDEWKKFENHFDNAHENFFRRLKAEYPELTPNDLKLCAYLRLNLSTKEIAPLLNISIRGVEVRRYRLRKRLNLSRQDNLVEFLMGF